MVALAPLPLLLVIGAGPHRLRNRASRPFVKTLPQKLRTGPAEMHPFLLPTRLRHRCDPTMFQHLVGATRISCLAVHPRRSGFCPRRGKLHSVRYSGRSTHHLHQHRTSWVVCRGLSGASRMMPLSAAVTAAGLTPVVDVRSRCKRCDDWRLTLAELTRHVPCPRCGAMVPFAVPAKGGVRRHAEPEKDRRFTPAGSWRDVIVGAS